MLSLRCGDELGFTLNRDLTVSSVQPAVKAQNVAPGYCLTAVNGKSVVGFAYEGVMAIIEKSKRKAGLVQQKDGADSPDACVQLSFGPAPLQPEPAPAPTAALQAMASLCASGDAAGTAQTGQITKTLQVEFTKPGPIGIHFAVSPQRHMMFLGVFTRLRKTSQIHNFAQERPNDDLAPLIIVKISVGSMAAEATEPSLSIGMTLDTVQGVPMSHVTL